jgi:hypothetical protein
MVCVTITGERSLPLMAPIATSHRFNDLSRFLGCKVEVSISNIFTPYLLKIGEDGGLENSLRFDKGLRNGLYLYHGILTNKTVGEWFDLKYSDINFLIF